MRKPNPKSEVILSETFTGSDGLLRAILAAAMKVLLESNNVDLRGMSGRLALTSGRLTLTRVAGGAFELKIEAR